MKTMISPDEALRIVLDAAHPQPPRGLPPADALGLVLAEDLCADRDYPPFDRAMMDGFAAKVADAGTRVPLVGEVPAGMRAEAPLAAGTALAIMTGAPCPAGTEVVVPVEDAVREGDEFVRLPESLKPGAHIAPLGCECRRDACVAPAGSVVTPLVVANAAAFGRDRLSVVPRPTAAIIVTGAEIAESAEASIRDSNGPMLTALLTGLGVFDVLWRHAVDTVEDVAYALAAAETADVVLLSGGVSAGKYDLVPDCLRAAGVELLFHKVTQKPGKPLLFGRKGARLYFGLPGNPLACHLGFHRYVRPAVCRMMGYAGTTPQARGFLATDVDAVGPRTVFQLCRVTATSTGFAVAPLSGRGSADLHSPSLANAYLRLDPGNPLAEGKSVPFEWIGVPPWMQAPFERPE